MASIKTPIRSRLSRSFLIKLSKNPVSFFQSSVFGNMSSSPLNSTEKYVSPEIDVCIVGGGLSGLTAAYKILSKESTLRVIVLESDQITGGQLFESQLGELGGKWFTPGQYHIHDLCKKLGVAIRRKELSKISSKRHWEMDRGSFGTGARFELQRLIDEMNLMATNYSPGAFKINQKTKTMERFICSKLFFEQSRQFIRCFVRLICGVEASDITVSEFMSVCRGSGGFDELVAVFTGTSSIIYEVSSQELKRNLEAKINSSAILLSTKVIEIVHYKNHVLIRDDKDNTFYAAALIMAIPWQNIQKVRFYPPIPQELRIPLFENKYMITSFLMRYTANHWRTSGYSGSVILHNPHIICYEYAPFAYGGLVLHDEYFQEILQPIVLNKLTEIFGQKMSTPLNWLQKTWEQATILNLPPTTPWNRVIWSSATAATCYRGCLSGAVQSGYRAALHALLLLRPQTIQWQDISEIQKAEAVKPRHNWLMLKFSALNLYNVLFHISLLGALYVTVRVVKIIRNELERNYY